MNKRVDKKGQFYLVAGIIIISVVVGLIGISNYIQKSQTVIVNNLKEELKIETQKVLEYDISGNQMQQYGKDYSSHLGSDIQLYFIMGEEPNIEAYKYVNGVDRTLLDEVPDPITQGDKIIFTLEDINYEFDLVGGENFYFLISQEIKGELFVATG